jgi:hypothetical protein
MRLEVENLITVQYHTNLDAGKKEDWPEYLVCRPHVGDYVCSMNGLKLRVVSVVHCHDGSKPYLHVELNK